MRRFFRKLRERAITSGGWEFWRTSRRAFEGMSLILEWRWKKRYDRTVRNTLFGERNTYTDLIRLFGTSSTTSSSVRQSGCTVVLAADSERRRHDPSAPRLTCGIRDPLGTGSFVLIASVRSKYSPFVTILVSILIAYPGADAWWGVFTAQGVLTLCRRSAPSLIGYVLLRAAIYPRA